MDKLQKLLNKHKDKITNWYKNIELRQMSWWNFRLYLRNEPWDIDYISLAEILFNTPFLSLLEWKRAYWERVFCPSIYQPWRLWWLAHLEYREKIDSERQKSDYHKINLCLLNSDEDRIKYLEDNTITND